MSFFRNAIALASNSLKRAAPAPASQEQQNKRIRLELDDDAPMVDAPLVDTSRQLVPMVSRSEASNFRAQPDFNFTNDTQLVPLVSRSEAANFQSQPGFNFINMTNDAAGAEVFEDAQEDVTTGATFSGANNNSLFPKLSSSAPQIQETDEDFLVADDQDGNPIYADWDVPPGAREQPQEDPDLIPYDEVENWLQHQSNASTAGQGTDADVSARVGVNEGNEKVEEWDELGSSPNHSADDADGDSHEQEIEPPVDLTNVLHEYDQRPQQFGYGQFGSNNGSNGAVQHGQFFQNGMTEEQFVNAGFFAQDYDGNFNPGTSQQDAIQIEDDDEVQYQDTNLAQTSNRKSGEVQHLGSSNIPREAEEQAHATEDDDDAHSDLFASTFGKKAANAEQDVIDISDDDDEEEEKDANTTSRPQRRLSTPPLPSAAPKPAPPPPSKKKSPKPVLRQGPNISNDISPLLKDTHRFHEKAFAQLAKIPNHSAPAYPWPSRRYWIPVLLEGKSPNNRWHEKDFIWMKGNKFTTVRTVREMYLTTTMCDEEGLEIRLGGGEKVDLGDVMEELDYFGDRVVVLRAVRGRDLLRGTKSLSEGIIPPVVEIID